MIPGKSCRDGHDSFLSDQRSHLPDIEEILQD